MARKTVQDLDCDTTAEFEKPGQSVEGFYLGNKTIETEFGKSKLHVFKGEDGSNFGVYGSHKLDEKLNSVPLGYMTFITFQGKVKIPGGKTMKKFDVDYDDEIALEGSAPIEKSPVKTPPEAEEPAAETSAPAEEAAGDDKQDTDESAAVEAEAEEAETEKNPAKAPLVKGKPAAATVTAAQKTNVQNALLSKSKR
jgi:hypothetical protein